jgi:hypothetical protein
MDAFDRFWQWAPADLHRAVMELALDDRRDRAKVNEAVKRAY